MAEEVQNPLATVKRNLGGRPRKQIVETKVETKPVQVSDEKEIGDNDEVKLTGKELKALKAMLASQSASKDDSVVKALIEALREAQKPYKSDADKENDRRQQEQMRKMVKDQLKNTEISQTYCQHMAGTNRLSDVPHPANAFTAIAWHDITPQLRWGICTVCQRQFWPTDTDYRYWRGKRSFNRFSQADSEGQRQGVDMQAWAAEEHPEPFGTKTGVDPSQIIRQQYMPTF